MGGSITRVDIDQCFNAPEEEGGLYLPYPTPRRRKKVWIPERPKIRSKGGR